MTFNKTHAIKFVIVALLLGIIAIYSGRISEYFKQFIGE